MSVSVSGLMLRRGPVQVLHGIDLAVGPGEVVCLAGPNGAGKSTILDTLAGLHPAAVGDVLVDGHPADSAEARRAVGALPAVPPLYDQLTPHEHLELLSRLWGLPAERVDRAVRSMQLESTLRLPAGQLSLGQRQRLAVAMVTLHDPHTLLLDEPFNGLDAATTQLLRAAVTRCAAGGGSVLVATHLLSALDGLATRLVYVHEGRILHDVPVHGRPLPDVVGEVGVELAEW